jgi:uncharacterized phage protein gp47/JayE
VATPDWKTLIGSKSFDELWDQATARLVALGASVTNLNEGGVYETLVSSVLWVLAGFYGVLEDIVPNGFLRYALGSWAELKAEDLDAARRPARATQGNLRVGRDQADGEMVIDEGSIFRTRLSVQGQYVQFRCRARTTLLDGQTAGDVPVECTQAGRLGNVSPGLVTEMVTVIDGVATITNEAGWITVEGEDQETIAALKERAQLQWYLLSRGTTANTYRAWALQVTGVVDVQVLDDFPRGEGTCDVVIRGAAGQPSLALVAAVQAYLDARRMNNLDVLVRGPAEQPVTVRYRVWLPADVGDEDLVRAALIARTNSRLSDGLLADVPRLGMGQSVIRAQLGALALPGVPTVQDVVVELPVANVIVPAGAMAVLEAAVEVIVERQS